MPTKDPTAPRVSRKKAPPVDQSALIAKLQAEIEALKAGGDKPESRASKNPDRLVEVENKRVRPEHYVGTHPKTGETVDFHFGTAPIAVAAGATPTTVPGSNPYRLKLPLWLVQSPRFQARVKKGHFEVRGSI